MPGKPSAKRNSSLVSEIRENGKQDVSERESKGKPTSGAKRNLALNSTNPTKQAKLMPGHPGLGGRGMRNGTSLVRGEDATCWPGPGGSVRWK